MSPSDFIWDDYEFYCAETAFDPTNSAIQFIRMDLNLATSKDIDILKMATISATSKNGFLETGL